MRLWGLISGCCWVGSHEKRREGGWGVAVWGCGGGRGWPKLHRRPPANPPPPLVLAAVPGCPRVSDKDNWRLLMDSLLKPVPSQYGAQLTNEKWSCCWGRMQNRLEWWSNSCGIKRNPLRFLVSILKNAFWVKVLTAWHTAQISGTGMCASICRMHTSVSQSRTYNGFD